MIEGVTVLNQTPIKTVSIIQIILWTVIVIVTLSFIMAEMYLIFPIALLCTVLVCVFVPTTHTGKYKYECTIDESVSFNELYEKYEIVEQRGSIWVLKDKEAE